MHLKIKRSVIEANQRESRKKMTVYIKKYKKLMLPLNMGFWGTKIIQNQLI